MSPFGVLFLSLCLSGNEAQKEHSRSERNSPGEDFGVPCVVPCVVTNSASLSAAVNLAAYSLRPVLSVKSHAPPCYQLFTVSGGQAVDKKL